MFATNRRSTMVALACAITAAMMGVGEPQARGAFTGAGEIIFSEAGYVGINPDPVVVTPLVFSQQSPGSPVYTTGNINVTVGDFTFNGTIVTSNAPGGATASETLATGTVVNNAGVSKTLTITVNVTGYTTPAPTVFMTNSLTGNITNGTGGNAVGATSFSSYLDATNSVYTSGTPLGTALFGGSQSVNGTSPQDLDQNATSPTFTFNDSVAGAYALNEQASLTLGSSSTASVSYFTNVYNATPAPSSALLAVAGMPVLGLAWMVRRRRSKVEGEAPAIA